MIERTIRSNELTTLEQVTNYTKAGGGCCMTCFETLEEILAKTNADMVEEGLIAAGEAYSSGSTDVVALKKKSREDKIRAKELASAANAPIQISGLQPLKPTEPEPAPVKRPVMTTLQKVRLVEKAIEDIRPFLKADGGDCELVDVDGDAVYVKLSGPVSAARWPASPSMASARNSSTPPACRCALSRSRDKERHNETRLSRQ